MMLLIVEWKSLLQHIKCSRMLTTSGEIEKVGIYRCENNETAWSLV